MDRAPLLPAQAARAGPRQRAFGSTHHSAGRAKTGAQELRGSSPCTHQLTHRLPAQLPGTSCSPAPDASRLRQPLRRAGAQLSSPGCARAPRQVRLRLGVPFSAHANRLQDGSDRAIRLLQPAQAPAPAAERPCDWAPCLHSASSTRQDDHVGASQGPSQAHPPHARTSISTSAHRLLVT